MDADRWERVQALFHEVVVLPEGERRTFLDSACVGDPGLAAEVLALVEEDARSASPLDAPLPEVARAVLGTPPAVPDQLGPYRIRSLLGQGGMGVVYLAERPDLESRVAIKVLRDAWLSPGRRERFAREQRLLARLTHPNIARIYDAATLPDGTPYFVMEHVDGVPITRYADEHALPIRERLVLFRAVCEAVHFAHRHAIIHRDLKPSNVLVTTDGSVKLLDFGISKQVEELDSPEDRTVTALRLMTPAYAAPEQIRGDPVGTYTDVYALGVVLYELITGSLPFDFFHLGPAQADAMVLERDPERPSALVRASGHPNMPAFGIGRAGMADLDVLCLTAMQKEPQRRYRTADALLRDVDRFLAGEPLEARPDTLRYRAGKFLRRKWRPVTAGAILAAGLIALVTFYTVRLARARDEAQAEATRTRRIQAFMFDLLQGGGGATGPADTLRVLTVVDRGVREARTLDREPAIQAELYRTLGGMYQKLGNFGRADTLLNAALVRTRALGRPARADMIKSVVALGMLRADEARLEEAEKLVRQGVALSARLLPRNDPVALHAQYALGHVLQAKGAYATAIPVLQGAVAALRTSDAGGAEYRTALRELADTHFYAGDYPTSDSLNHELLGMDRRRYGSSHPDVADDLINLGAIQYDLGRYTDAERYYRQAIAINLPFYGPEHPEYAADLTMLARALLHEPDREVEARDLLLKSLRIRERVYGLDHPLVASTLNELGHLAQVEDSLDLAAGYFRRMAAIYDKTYSGPHYLKGIALSNLGGTYLAGKRYTEAEPIFRGAIAIFARTQGPAHLNTGIARIKLGRTLLGEHRYAEAIAESRAGYDILSRQADPHIPFLISARKDLVAAYDSIGQPGLAARFRAELRDTLRKTAGR